MQIKNGDKVKIIVTESEVDDNGEIIFNHLGFPSVTQKEYTGIIGGYDNEEEFVVLYANKGAINFSIKKQDQ